MRALFVFVLLIFCAAPASATENGDTNAAQVRATTQIGTRDGAGYRIDIPSNWNRGLVVFFHGYSIDPVRFEKGEAISPVFEPILRSGFAVVQSAYSQGPRSCDRSRIAARVALAALLQKHKLL